MAAPWEQIALAARTALVTDLDGSLVPFDVDPARAMPSAEVVALLAELASYGGTLVVVASGRPVRDLEQSFGDLPSIDLVAEHGLMVREAGAWTSTAEVDPLHFDDLAARLAPVAVEGASLERKSLGLAFHVRAVDPSRKSVRLAVARELIEAFVEHEPLLERLEGNEVIEVRARGVTKANAIALAHRRLGPDARILAIGDDVTDEDMFRALGPADLGVRVGKTARASAASFEVSGTDEAIALLRSLRDMRRAR